MWTNVKLFYIFEELVQNICYTIYEDVNLSIDAIGVLPSYRIMYRLEVNSDPFSMIQY